MLLQTKSIQKGRGVTFIEILVSMLILAASLAGIISLFGSTKRWIEASQSRMAMGEIGKFVLDPLQMQVRQDQWNPGTNCLSSGGAVGCQPSVPIQNRNYQVVYTINNDQPIANVNRVSVFINWTNEQVF